MNTSRTRRQFAAISLGIVCTLSFLLPVAGQGQNGPQKTKPRPLKVALVTVLKSPVSWNPDCIHPVPGGWRTLSPSSNPRELHAGEVIRCGRGGAAQIILASGKITMTSGQTLPIVNVPPPERVSLDTVLAALLVTAGNPRGITPRFLSPADSDARPAPSIVWPKTFTFEWRPLPPGTSLTLALRGAPGGRPLWQEVNIDAARGRYASPGAREALARWENTGKSSAVLEVQPSNGTAYHILFRLLSASQERSLMQSLAVWSSRPGGLLRHLGQAFIFSQYKLYPESASEYAAALQLAPDSLLIRHRTVKAYKMYQNQSRAEALEMPKDHR